MELKVRRRIPRRGAWGLLCGVTCLLAAGCGGETGGQNDNTSCPAGFEREGEGEACLPVFEECTGAAEIPVLGSGCLQIGVTRCATGFEADGAGGCEPILPAETCPVGTMAVIGEETCLPVGPTACAEGFEADGDGGCAAVLPAGACGDDEIALLGHATCQPVGTCGAAPWGDIVHDATTIYVDAGYTGSATSGTMDEPFRRIQDGLDAATTGAQIAVAAGLYVEALRITAPVRLVGRCAREVHIHGPRLDAAAWMGDGTSGSQIRGVTFTGDSEGLLIERATGVLVEDVVVRDTDSVGIFVFDDAEAVLRRVSVRRARSYAVVPISSEVELDQVEVQGTRRDPDNKAGVGVNPYCDLEAGPCGYTLIRRSVIQDGSGVGLVAVGTTARLEDSLIRNTDVDEDGLHGYGVYAFCDLLHGYCGSVEVVGSVVADNHDYGLLTVGVDLTVTNTVVRDTQPIADGSYGRGIAGHCDTASGSCPTLEVSNSLVLRNHDVGVTSRGADLTIRSTAIRDTLIGSVDSYGRGLMATCSQVVDHCGELVLVDSLVQSSLDTGLLIANIESELTGVTVLDTRPSPPPAGWGRGIEIHCYLPGPECPGTRLERVLVAGNRETGLALFNVHAEVVGSAVLETGVDESGNFGRGLVAACLPGAQDCGSLLVDGSYFDANHDVGVAIFGVPSTVQHTTIQNTLPEERLGTDGRGLVGQCQVDSGSCADITLVSSLVRGSQIVGVYFSGVHGQVQSSIVQDTRPNAGGVVQGAYGHAVWAACSPELLTCGSLSLLSSLLRSSHVAALALQGVSGSITDSVIDDVRPQVSDGAYGYGVQVEGTSVSPDVTFDVLRTLIRSDSLAGVLYYHANGSVAGCDIAGASYSVVMNQGSVVTVGEDNRLSGSTEDEPAWSNMDPAPAPGPVLPFGL